MSCDHTQPAQRIEAATEAALRKLNQAKKVGCADLQTDGPWYDFLRIADEQFETLKDFLAPVTDDEARVLQESHQRAVGDFFRTHPPGTVALPDTTINHLRLHGYARDLDDDDAYHPFDFERVAVGMSLMIADGDLECHHGKDGTQCIGMTERFSREARVRHGVPVIGDPRLTEFAGIYGRLRENPEVAKAEIGDPFALIERIVDILGDHGLDFSVEPPVLSLAVEGYEMSVEVEKLMQTDPEAPIIWMHQRLGANGNDAMSLLIWLRAFVDGRERESK